MASVVMAHGLSCSKACKFLTTGSPGKSNTPIFLQFIKYLSSVCHLPGKCEILGVTEARPLPWRSPKPSGKAGHLSLLSRGPHPAVRAWAGRSQFSGVVGNTSKRKNLPLQAPEDAQVFSQCEVEG